MENISNQFVYMAIIQMRSDQMLLLRVNIIVQFLLHFTLKEVPLLIKGIEKVYQLSSNVKELLQGLRILLNLPEVLFNLHVDVQLLVFHFVKLIVH